MLFYNLLYLLVFPQNKQHIFQNLYSDSDLSESFVTNIEIFKWLFNSFIYTNGFKHGCLHKTNEKTFDGIFRIALDFY